MPPDYLSIGHICQDITPQGPRLGGPAAYSALCAAVIGQKTAIVTSSAPDAASLLQPLRQAQVHTIPAEQSTTFENIYTPQGRVQHLLGRAQPLSAPDVPAAWAQAAVIHVAPVADELPHDLLGGFPGSFIGLTPQGWMRRWDDSGRVYFKPLGQPETLLSRPDAVVMSIEDVGNDEALAAAYAACARVMVVTRGAQGCTLFMDGQAQHIQAQPHTERDPTGAGDIFAAAFFIYLQRSGQPIAAAHFATVIAAHSVGLIGMEAMAAPDGLAAALPAAYAAAAEANL